jgi:hypothetical protein
MDDVQAEAGKKSMPGISRRRFYPELTLRRA